ncbi:MAG: hypothetical protein K0S44_3155 [Bacteroidetes bacterium]|jgi:hypothetical protein|nr:hypothetical protein [Bacteroidota bacterium]
MDNYLLAIGWWNLAGSILMLSMLYQPIGKKILNDWCLIFKKEFSLDYWGKLWFFWASGLNIFFGLINIISVQWGFIEVKTFLIKADLLSYLIFIGLAIWGFKEGKMGPGIYSVFVIFSFWIIWGLIVIYG